MKGVIIISNFKKRNIFLNKKMILTWNYNQTAFFIKSPLNPRAGFWWARQWYQDSKYPNYFSVGIILDKQYQEIVYCENGIENTRLVSGKELFDGLQRMKINNQIQYFRMSANTKEHIKKVNYDIEKYNFDINAKKEWI